MLADAALPDDAGDKLGFKPFANAIAGIIDSPKTATPLVMAINAQWGAGKTTLGQMIRHRLDTKSAADGYAPHVTCWFGAWMHDDAPTLGTALAAEVAKAAGRSRPLWRRILNPLPSSLATAGQKKLRKGIRYAAALVAVVAFLIFVSWFSTLTLGVPVGLPANHVIFPRLSGIAFLVGLIALAIVLHQLLAAILPAARSVGEFARDPQTAAKSASMEEVRRELGKLIEQATPKGSKFVIFIDDLDRCRPPRSVDVLEAVNQLLDHPGVVVVLMSDMQVVTKCAEIKFKHLATSEAPATTSQSSTDFSAYGRNLLQKIVQLQFDLPIYSARKIRQMVGDLAKEVPRDRTTDWLDADWKGAWSRIQRGFSSLGGTRDWASWIFYVLVALAIGRLVWKANTAPEDFPAGVIFTEMLVILFVLFTGEWFARILVRMRESGRRRQIDQQIRAKTTGGERDFSKVEAYVRGENSAWRNDPEMEGLVTERLQRYLEDESELQLEAEDELMQHLEPVPRHAKRLLNRLRLLLFIAHERRMLGGKPELSSRHIGKWAVLGERWPELLQAVCMDPDIMKPLEDSETHDAVIKERAPLYANDEALRRFCFSRGGLKLWPVVKRMVEFVPATDRRAKPPAP